MRRAWLLVLVLSGGGVVGCASDVGTEDDPDGDDPPGEATSEAMLRERWRPPTSSARGTYEGAPAWNGGRACAGGMMRGTKALGDRIRSAFTVSRVEGYACRPNTANSSEMSVHGTGRAIDIFATAGAGDQVAKWLVENADELGVQLVIWNRTLWKITTAGPSSRAYGGPNPHTDHVHAELTKQAAAR